MSITRTRKVTANFMIDDFKKLTGVLFSGDHCLSTKVTEKMSTTESIEINIPMYGQGSSLSLAKQR